VGDVAVMEIQEVRGVVVRFQDRQVLLTEMRVPTLATVESEEKGIIGIIGIEKIQGSEVKSVIAGNRSEKCIEKVVFLIVELAIENTEDFIELGAGTVHLRLIQIIDDDCEGKLAEIVPFEFDLFDALTEFPNLGLLRIIG